MDFTVTRGSAWAGLTQWHKVLLVSLLSIAAFLLYLPPETGSALMIPPDSSEYAIGLTNLYEGKGFGITLNGQYYHSRYTPWFSVLCLTPSYVLGAGSVLSFNVSILFFALVVLCSVYWWGRIVGLGRLALLSSCLIMLLPDFVFYSRIVMTEIPYTAVLAIGGLLFCRIPKEGVSVRCALLCGCLLAWGGMIRPTMLPMVLPFAYVILKGDRNWSRRIVLLAILGLPIMAYEALNLWHNKMAFGSAFRSGYQYWLPIPCDFPSLLFSGKYIGANLTSLAKEPVWWATVSMLLVTNLAWWCGRVWGLGRWQDESFGKLLAYLDCQFVVLAGLYSAYYWDDMRFFLPVSVCILPLFIGACNRFLRLFRAMMFGIVLAFVSVIVAITFLASRPRYFDQALPRQIWLAKAQIAARVLPEKSVVIQFGDPNILDHFGFRDRSLFLLPFERKFDYVRHMIAPSSIRNLIQTPSSCNQRNIPELIEKGICKLPFPRTFLEDPEQIRRFLDSGMRVFFEQDILEGETAWEPFQHLLCDHGFASKFYGVWEVDAVRSNSIRHFYDRVVFPDFSMDSRPPVTAVYHEIVCRR